MQRFADFPYPTGPVGARLLVSQEAGVQPLGSCRFARFAKVSRSYTSLLAQPAGRLATSATWIAREAVQAIASACGRSGLKEWRPSSHC